MQAEFLGGSLSDRGLIQWACNTAILTVRFTHMEFVIVIRFNNRWTIRLDIK